MNDIYVGDKSTIVAATTSGLVYTQNVYSEEKESIRFTEDDVYSLYRESELSIGNFIDGTISSHEISPDHAKDGLYQRINDDYMDVAFKELGRFQFTTKDERYQIQLSNLGGEVYTRYATTGSFDGYYFMTINGNGTDRYFVRATVDQGENDSFQIFVFFFDENHLYLGSFWSGEKTGPGNMDLNTMIPPSGTRYAQIRFDANTPRSTVTVSNVTITRQSISNRFSLQDWSSSQSFSVAQAMGRISLGDGNFTIENLNGEVYTGYGDRNPSGYYMMNLEGDGRRKYLVRAGMEMSSMTNPPGEAVSEILVIYFDQEGNARFRTDGNPYLKNFLVEGSQEFSGEFVPPDWCRYAQIRFDINSPKTALSVHDVRVTKDGETRNRFEFYGWKNSKSNSSTGRSDSVLVVEDPPMISAQGDYVDNMVEGTTEESEDVIVAVRNFATAGEWTKVPAQYTIKMWKSGFNEFDIYVPTTYTYYLNHNPGTPNCKDAPQDVIKRSNLYTAKLRNQSVNDRLSSALSSYYTDIQVWILSTQYEFTDILDASINGSSLPLYIYKDDSQEADEGKAGKMYHSFIEPSMFTRVPSVTSVNDWGYYDFRACCFGTDSQSIQIQALCPTTGYYRGNILKITYHGNSGKDMLGREEYVQKVRASIDGRMDVLADQHMIPNQFAIGNKRFWGWCEAKVDDNDIDRVQYADMTEITSSLFRKRKAIHLYAVWLDVDWTKSHTEYTIDTST